MTNMTFLVFSVLAIVLCHQQEGIHPRNTSFAKFVDV